MGEVTKIVWSDGSESTVIDGIIQPDGDSETERGREAWENDEVFDFDAQSDYFQEAYEEAWFETVNPSTDGDDYDQAWSNEKDRIYWRFKEQQEKKVNNLISNERQYVP